MDNPTALTQFEHYLRRGFPERSTAKHYLSDLRQFQKVCTNAWGEVTPADVDAFVDYGQQAGWQSATASWRVAALKTFFEFWAMETEKFERPNPVQPWRHAPKRGQRLPVVRLSMGNNSPLCWLHLSSARISGVSWCTTHTAGTTKSITLLSVSGHVEPTQAMRQDSVVAAFLGRQSRLGETDAARFRK